MLLYYIRIYTHNDQTGCIHTGVHRTANVDIYVFYIQFTHIQVYIILCGKGGRLSAAFRAL